MQAQYIAVYKLEGLSSHSSDEEIHVCDNQKLDARAFLATSIDDHCFNADRGFVLMAELLKGFFGQSKPQEINDLIANGVKARVDRRRKEFGQGTFLVFLATTEIENPDFKIRRDFADFAACFDAVDKDKWKRLYRGAEDQILVSFAVSLPSTRAPTFRRVLDAMYLVEASGKIVYSFSATAGSARVIISGQPDPSLIDSVQCHVRALEGRQGLLTASKLFAQSLDRALDDLRSFIMIWSAWEIFLNDAFGACYENSWAVTIENKSVEWVKKLGVRPQAPYHVSHKFLMIAVTLDNASAEQDYALFRDCNRRRNRLFHGSEKSEENLPVEQLQNLLRKYFRLHLAFDGLSL